MAFSLPSHFIEDINHLGNLIRLCDGTRSDESRRDHLLAGMATSCSLLKELSGFSQELAAGVNQIQANTQAMGKLLTEHGKLFLGIEDLILRDAGIDGITRKIMLDNIRRIGIHTGLELVEFSGSDVVGTLDNLQREVCGRADDLGNDAKTLNKRIRAVITFGLPPINIAVATLHPAFLPVVFKASSWVGTIVSKAILQR